ncbi:MAG: hypothetical protein LC770_05505, partial [Acidobacteria bacterium]|nr:hypothetical protein [Acidobacteriota bacterium]
MSAKAAASADLAQNVATGPTMPQCAGERARHQHRDAAHRVEDGNAVQTRDTDMCRIRSPAGAAIRTIPIPA